jgi:hypothetical protein
MGVRGVLMEKRESTHSQHVQRCGMVVRGDGVVYVYARSQWMRTGETLSDKFRDPGA